MASTIAVVTRIGERRPGTAAVVITMSALATSPVSVGLLGGALLGGELARVAAGGVRGHAESLTNVAPADSASSLAAVRTS